jgi:hypothetical protein
MRCFCCEQNDATHLITTDQGEQVPYCDECDGGLSPETIDDHKEDKVFNIKLNDTQMSKLLDYLESTCDDCPAEDSDFYTDFRDSVRKQAEEQVNKEIQDEHT